MAIRRDSLEEVAVIYLEYGKIPTQQRNLRAIMRLSFCGLGGSCEHLHDGQYQRDPSIVLAPV
jgi:hypothetical protein